MVIHDDMGEFVCYCSLVHPGVMQIDEGEAWGVVEAIKQAGRLGLNWVIVESDSKWVVDALKLDKGGESVLGTTLKKGSASLCLGAIIR